eukprot:gene13501-4381_t
MQDSKLPVTKNFKYLSSTLQSGGGVKAEVIRRIQCGWSSWKKMSGVFCDRKIPHRVKGVIYRTLVQPVMLYGMETVPLSVRDTNKLEVVEMKMCRWALGHTLKDHCKESRLRWFGHVKRRDETYVGRKVMEMRLPGGRKRSRPKLRWMDCVKKDLDSVGAKEEDALDKRTWRKMIAAATPLDSGTNS